MEEFIKFLEFAMRDFKTFVGTMMILALLCGTLIAASGLLFEPFRRFKKKNNE